MSENRRHFLRNFLKKTAINTISSFREGVEEAREQQDMDDFFSSYESSYALTLNYPDDILIATAIQEGVEVEGRDKNDIAKELFRKKGGWG